MLIGDGMMAQAFAERKADEKHIIFAAGVSDSGECRRAAFLREQELLCRIMETNPDKTVVYFSTCGMYDSTLHNSPYIHHKLEMERLLRTYGRPFVIFRLPQVVGRTQSPTLVNFLYHKIANRQPFELWANSKRNLIDVQDVVKTVNYILDNRCFIGQIVNLASSQTYSIYQIVTIIEQLTQKRAIYNKIDRGGFYHIDLTQVQAVYQELGINFSTDYAAEIIRKYYGSSDSV